MELEDIQLNKWSEEEGCGSQNEKVIHMGNEAKK